jgi:hypothetical protein
VADTRQAKLWVTHMLFPSLESGGLLGGTPVPLLNLYTRVISIVEDVSEGVARVMILAGLILILAAAMSFFYLQVTCQRILRRQFEREYFQSIANVIRLEFPSLRKALEDFGVSVDYSRVPRALKCDFLALTHLLKTTAGAKQGYSKAQSLLILYFRWQFLSLAVRRSLRVGEKKAALRLTSVLQYFANAIGQHLYADEFGNLKADCLVNL